MEALKLLERHDLPLQWNYDAEADVLYLSIGSPRPAVGIDVGEGLVVRYDEVAGEVVGLTVIGIAQRLSSALPADDRPDL